MKDDLVVMDIGGGSIRAGFVSGNLNPRLEIVTALAKGKRDKKIVKPLVNLGKILEKHSYEMLCQAIEQTLKNAGID